MIYRFKIVFFYFFGRTIGKLAYSSFKLSGKHFSRPGSIGWEWVFKCFFWQKIMGINNHVPWPTSFKISVGSPENIIFHPDDLNNFMTHGNYYQAVGAKLTIGKGTYIAPNVGIITENHDLRDPEYRAVGKDVIIGEKCWIGMNAVILPGVVLGDHTVVGAGAIVTKSFREGYCVIGGNPARLIKTID
jgi:acetyltransferase-like isoleucine patch superfamily enzyme